ncbi:MAG: hypothetical protein MRK02_14460 [Candidatus Scalindua sp.]|nr:hypothetical protein [Candidatus Scalindua sp.]
MGKNRHLTLDDPHKYLTLKSDEIHIWRASSDLLSTEIERFEQALSDDELKRACRYVFMKDRNRFITGRGILRTILGLYLKNGTRSVAFPL